MAAPAGNVDGFVESFRNDMPDAPPY